MHNNSYGSAAFIVAGTATHVLFSPLSSSTWSKASSGGKCKSGCLHFRRIKRYFRSFDDFLRMLGFPICFHQVCGTTPRQLGGSTYDQPTVGLGHIWNSYLVFSRSQHLMSPCTNIQLGWAFTPLNFGLYAFETVSTLVFFSRQNRIESKTSTST